MNIKNKKFEEWYSQRIPHEFNGDPLWLLEECWEHAQHVERLECANIVIGFASNFSLNNVVKEILENHKKDK